jgi:hypothetical protein
MLQQIPTRCYSKMLTRVRAHATAACYDSSWPDPSDEEAQDDDEAEDDDEAVADEAPAAAAVSDRAAMSALARELEVWGGCLTRPQVYAIRDGSSAVCAHVCVCRASLCMHLYVPTCRHRQSDTARAPQASDSSDVSYQTYAVSIRLIRLTYACIGRATRRARRAYV